MFDWLEKISSIKHKLLFAFVTFLVAVTLLNAALSAYLVNQQSEAEASARLARELTVFRNDLKDLRASLEAAAREAAADYKNLSDLAIAYNQRLRLHKQSDALLENTFNLNKISSLNRLQLVLQSARLSSAAVYLKDDLSHYITRDEAGMVVHRDDQHILLGSDQKLAGKLRLNNWRSWGEQPNNALVPATVTELNQLTISVDYLKEKTVVLRASVPIQAVARVSFTETIIEDLAIATPEALNPLRDTEQRPEVVGMFVFTKIIDQAFIQELAARTGMLPAIFAPNGLNQKQIVGLTDPSQPLPAPNGKLVDWRTVQIGTDSYYQGFMPWQVEKNGSSLILSMAISRASTLATIRNIVIGIGVAAFLVLLVGGASAYLAITRLVAPIKELTLSVSAMELGNQETSGEEEEIERVQQAALGDYLEHPIVPQTKDEVSELTVAFNAMAGQLHHLIGGLETKVAERTRALTESNQQLRAAEQTAEEARKIAESANKAKSVFLANMSHELRTPLNAILGYTNILQRYREDQQSVSEGLDIIQSSGEHLLTLINDILDLAKVEAGKLEMHPAPVSLPGFLQQIVGIVRARAEAKNLLLTYDNLSPLPAIVITDETRLRQVLLNLLGNAVKFNDEGRVSLTVTALDQPHRAKQDQVSLRFMVEDSGVGIAPEQLERIFLPFEQTGEVIRQEEGTGLGLAISRQIVREMGGQLLVESELGQGSSFWFDLTLPLSENAPSEHSTLPLPIVGYLGERRKLLVVDDRLYNRRLLLDLLQPLGFELASAENGQQAIDMAVQWLPDAIIMDLLMPVKTGFEAAREMRQMPELKDKLMIAVSASVSKTDQGKSREAGFDAFIPKPINLQRLFDLLGTNLQLTWEYAEAEIQREAPMVIPPSEELQALHQLAEDGKIFEIQQMASELEAKHESYIPFAQKLQKLAQAFDMERIQALIKPPQNGRNSGDSK